MSSFLETVALNIEQLGEKTFIRCVGNKGQSDLSWKRFGNDCGRFVTTYNLMNLRSKANIFIFLEQDELLYSAFFGAMFGGYVPCFMPCLTARQNPDIYWRSHIELFEKVKPDLVVASRETIDQMRLAGISFAHTKTVAIDEISDIISPLRTSYADSDIGLLQHSSGTTGLKKGVALQFSAIEAQLKSYSSALEISSSDSIVSWLPLYHDMGLIACLILPSWAGLHTVHIDPFFWLSRPAVLLDYLEQQKSPFCWLPNFAFEHLNLTCARKAAEYKLGHVRAFISCSEVVKSSSMNKFANAFELSGVSKNQLQACYAMAETVFAVTQTQIGVSPSEMSFNIESLEPGNVPLVVENGAENSIILHETGIPINGIKVEIADSNGAIGNQSIVGEICLSGEFLFAGYNCDPNTTAQRLKDGHYFSRDLGFIIDNHLFVLGRLDDVIIVNGRNIYAHDVEASLASLNGIKPGRIVAFSVLDNKSNSDVMIIMMEAIDGVEIDAQEIENQASEIVFSIFAVKPREVILTKLGELIKTTSGKISRKENRLRYLQNQSRK